MQIHEIGLIAAMIVVSFSAVMVLLPSVIRRLVRKGVVAVDKYKKDLRVIPTRGGIVIICAVFLIFGIVSLLAHLPGPISVPIHLTGADWAILIVAGLFAAFGLVDDFLDVGRPVKIFILFFFSYRLVFEITSTMVLVPFVGYMDFGVLYLFLIIPLYVLVTANLANMHSGFNGLASGL